MDAIFLTHSPGMLATYYGERATAGISAPGETRLHNGNRSVVGGGIDRDGEVRRRHRVGQNDAGQVVAVRRGRRLCRRNAGHQIYVDGAPVNV